MSNKTYKYSTTKLLVTVPPKNVQLFLQSHQNRNEEGGLRTKGLFKKSYPNKPLISIVTVVYNGERFLEDTIVSILSQDYDNIEYIIIDGYSTDRTVEIIKKYENQIDYWVSEEDEGMYDALNKGFSIAMGDIFGFINADDCYRKNIFSTVIESFKKDTELDLVIGNTIFQYANGLELKYKTCYLPISMARSIPRMFFAQPSTFFSAKIYFKLNGFDLKYKLSADFDFYSRIFNEVDHYKYIDKVFSKFKFIKYKDDAKYKQLSSSENQTIIKLQKKPQKFLNIFTELYLKLINICPIYIKKINDKDIPYEKN